MIQKVIWYLCYEYSPRSDRKQCVLEHRRGVCRDTGDKNNLKDEASSTGDKNNLKDEASSTGDKNNLKDEASSDVDKNNLKDEANGDGVKNNLNMRLVVMVPRTI